MATPLPRQPPEPGEHDLSSKIAGLPPAQTNTMSAVALGVGAAIGDDGDAVRGHHRLAAGGGVPPAIKLLARDAGWRRASGSTAAA